MNMTQLTVRFYGDPCLREESVLVEEVGVSERMLIEAMIEAMHEHKGIGLAAPQVGINQQIFVVDIGDEPVVVVNPKIIKKSGSAVLEEGCLCMPGVTVEIKRPQKIRVQYLDEHNKTVQEEYANLMARVFLHETDHLHGKLIIDYAGRKKKAELKDELQEFIQQYQSN